jgi:hypothetical protein
MLHPRLRYSGCSIGYQFSSVNTGGPAPSIVTALLAATGSGYLIALYILFCAVVNLDARLRQQGHSEEKDRP